MPRRGMVLSAALLAGLAVGCGSSTSGAPSPGGSASPGASTPGDSAQPGPALPHDGAPKVPHPVDVARYKKHPCAVLTPTQLRQAGLKKGTADPNAGAGPQCSWDAVHGRLNVGIAFIKNSGGLSDLYAENKQPNKFEVFQRVPDVNGFPAVLSLISDGRNVGDCAYDVGLNDRDEIGISVLHSTSAHPCDDVRNVANGITTTIKNGAQ